MAIHRLLIASGALLATVGAAAPAFAESGQPKITICHGSANHYVVITVDANAVHGHFDGTEPGHGWRNMADKLPDANGSCEGGIGAPL
jgi:hypothetical protein